MKKVLLSISLALVSIAAMGQNVETLQGRIRKGDPMLGTKDAVLYIGNNVMITEPTDDSTPSIVIKCQDHVFTGYGVKVGLYNDNDSLLHLSEFTMREKRKGSQHMNVYFSMFKDSVEFASYRDNDKKYPVYAKNGWFLNIRSLLKYLRKNGGYVRIVAEEYGGAPFDTRFRIKD